MKEYSPKDVAQLCKQFVESDFGQYVIEQLSLQYNDLHQMAERDDLSDNQKARAIERSIGVKQVMTFFTSRAANLDSGFYDKDGITQQS